MSKRLTDERLWTAVANFRALHQLNDQWKTWVENKALQVHMTTPDGWRCQASFCWKSDLDVQSTAFLNSEYERRIVRHAFSL
jgi:hypothetical protein